MRFKNQPNPRVFVGLMEIAGYYKGLVASLRGIGLSVTHININTHEFYSLPEDKHNLVILLSNRLTQLLAVFQRRRFLRWVTRPMQFLQRLILLIWTIATCDIYVFAFGRSFFDCKELPLLKLLGKKIIFIFNGSDTRPPFLSGIYIKNQNLSISDISTTAGKMKRNLQKIEKYADYCINHPLSGQFHERPFINHLFIGHPVFAAPGEPQSLQGHINKKIIIVHAPSRPALKGTQIFREMIQRLEATTANIEYVELSNKPHEEVIKALASCDLVLDELYSDIPLAGLGSEAAIFGKPAIVGGYAEKALAKAASGLPLPMDCYGDPSKVESILARLVKDKAWRERCGEKARQFLEEHWCPEMLARRFLSIIKDEVPPHWMCQPVDIDYFYGWGVSQSDLRDFLFTYMRQLGVKALFLSDKPSLESLITDFAGLDSRQ